jgi:hypothetical protein
MSKFIELQIDIIWIEYIKITIMDWSLQTKYRILLVDK